MFTNVHTKNNRKQDFDESVFSRHVTAHKLQPTQTHIPHAALVAAGFALSLSTSSSSTLSRARAAAARRAASASTYCDGLPARASRLSTRKLFGVTG